MAKPLSGGNFAFLSQELRDSSVLCWGRLLAALGPCSAFRFAPAHKIHLGPDAISVEVRGISLDYSANWVKRTL